MEARGINCINSALPRILDVCQSGVKCMLCISCGCVVMNLADFA